MNPYQIAPETAFWRNARRSLPGDLAKALFQPKIQIGINDRYMLAGSCFAQHLCRALKSVGLNVVDTERPPSGLPAATAKRYGFGQFSSRYGNIYSSRQMRELFEAALEIAAPHTVLHKKGDRYYDGLRPSVEPDGFDTPEEAIRLRAVHLEAVKRALNEANVLVITLGSTETWIDPPTGSTLPNCPGVVAGVYSDQTATFKNLTFMEVLEDLERIRDLFTSLGKDRRLVVTVSPVPLVATATGISIAQANTRSKSILRAAVDQFAGTYSDVEYFPSFDLVTYPAFRDDFFEDDLRRVTGKAVRFAIDAFMAAHGLSPCQPKSPTGLAQGLRDRTVVDQSVDASEVLCDEEFIEAFQ